MEYVIARQQPTSAARFGSLVTPEGRYELPAASCGVRTGLDVSALEENVLNGMPMRVLTPFASYGLGLGTQVARLARPPPTLSSLSPPNPLVIADPEAEAFSFHATAQDNYKRTKPTPTDSTTELLSTGLGGENPVHETWRRVLRSNGPAPLTEWMMNRMMAVRSDVFTVPAPIIRKDPESVTLAFAVIHDLVREARTQGQASFTKFGAELLVHGEIFQRSKLADQVRDLIFRNVQAWARDPRMGDMFLALKVYDPGPILSNPENGGSARQALGSLVRHLGRAIRLSGGVLVVHNAGTWMLGFHNDGADIVDFRVTGPRKIDVPVHGGKKGPFETPYLLIPRALVELPPDEVQRVYLAEGAYAKPDCIKCEEYWSFSSPSDQRLFCARQRAGVLTELADHYRNAGVDDGMPLDEAVDSLISEARIKQELVDLFQSSGPGT